MWHRGKSADKGLNAQHRMPLARLCKRGDREECVEDSPGGRICGGDKLSQAGFMRLDKRPRWENFGWSALGLPAGSRESEKERWPQSELSWGPIHPEHGIYDVAVASRR